MSKNKPTYDVFLSHAPQDVRLATEAVEVLQSFDLAVFDAKTLAPAASRNLEKTLWEAMAESQAFVVIISAREPSANTLFELGAAQGWNKPVYVVAADPASTRIPDFLQSYPVYPSSRLEEVAHAIKALSVMTDAEKELLIEEYHRIGEPVDQLVLQPVLLSKLTKQFQKRAKRQVASEELLRMLLRLRKRGALRPTASGNRAKVQK